MSAIGTFAVLRVSAKKLTTVGPMSDPYSNFEAAETEARRLASVTSSAYVIAQVIGEYVTEPSVVVKRLPLAAVTEIVSKKGRQC